MFSLLKCVLPWIFEKGYMFERKICSLSVKTMNQNTKCSYRQKLEKVADILFEGSRDHILIAIFGIFL